MCQELGTYPCCQPTTRHRVLIGAFRVVTLSGVQGRSPWWGSGATPQRAASNTSLARRVRGGPGGGRGLVAMHGPFPPPGRYGVNPLNGDLQRCPTVLPAGRAARRGAPGIVCPQQQSRQRRPRSEGAEPLTGTLRNRHPQIDSGHVTYRNVCATPAGAVPQIPHESCHRAARQSVARA